MPSQNHVHAYVRMRRPKGSKDPLAYYKCAYPDCTHWQHKGALLGKASVCVHCSQEFILTPAHLLKAEPKCPACVALTKSQKVVLDMVEPLIAPAETETELESILGDLLK